MYYSEVMFRQKVDIPWSIYRVFYGHKYIFGRYYETPNLDQGWNQTVKFICLFLLIRTLD